MRKMNINDLKNNFQKWYDIQKEKYNVIYLLNVNFSHLKTVCDEISAETNLSWMVSLSILFQFHFFDNFSVELLFSTQDWNIMELNDSNDIWVCIFNVCLFFLSM